MTLRAIIVDDEALARRRIRRLLRGEPDIEIIAECADGQAALTEIAVGRPGLVLLDVQMPELDGFEVVRRLPQSALPDVIFITAFDRYAIRAFDVHAIDYLLKPVTRERLRVALDRARERIGRRARDSGLVAFVEELKNRARCLARVAVRSRGRIVLVPVEAIDWIEAADNYVTLHTGGREYILRETLASLERQLDPQRFVRIHRSTLVQIDRIAELHPATHGDVVVRLRDGTELALSRTWRERLERSLGRVIQF
jgi:two-component system, LytTR family, response regulator